MVARGPEPKSVALVCWYDYYLHRYRLGLIRELSRRGHVVYAVAAPGRYVGPLREAGATFVPWRVTSRGINPVSELRAVLDLRSIYRRIRPSIAHHFTVKSNIYGAIAARMAGVPASIASVTGLGYTLTNPSLKARVIGSWVGPLYRFSNSLTDVVVFQNRDDQARVAGGSGDDGRAVYMPGGAGVDLDTFRPEAVDQAQVAGLRRELGLAEDELVVALIGRMIWEKGLAEYRDAARALQGHQPKARFLLVGRTEDGVPGYIPTEELNRWSAEGSVTYLGERLDVREILAMCDLVVLPSYWEGTPRALLEASAMGKAMVASDAPGCRDVVEHGVTGLLVPPRDVGSLVESIGKLLADADLRTRYGNAAREKAVAEFDEHMVTDRFVQVYESLWNR